MTSDTPSWPTRNVTTEAGALANAAELKPVTVACAQLAGVTVTPRMLCLPVCASGSLLNAPASGVAAGCCPFTLVSRAPRSCAAVKLAGMPAAAIPADEVVLAEAAAPEPAAPAPDEEQPATAPAAASSAAACGTGRAPRHRL